METIRYTLPAALLITALFWGSLPSLEVSAASLKARTDAQIVSDSRLLSCFSDDFQSGSLSEARWSLTRKNDFHEGSVSVQDVSKDGSHDFRVRLTANTLGTADETVKSIGLRTVRPVDLSHGVAIGFDLDWNRQVNGCYLSAGMTLCPTPTNGTSSDEPNWIRFEVLGVPPGKKARFQALRKSGGRFGVLYDEGWPDRQREGRTIDSVRIRIEIDGSALRVSENGVELFRTCGQELNFAEAYLYFEMSSHSNYPARSLTFDNIEVAPLRGTNRSEPPPLLPHAMVLE